METNLVPSLRDTPAGRTADTELRACVHCGFCNATCPTYQLLGDELDGPRGRIYQIKQVLEGAAPTRTTQLHLDRCLTCRACETTCPSGVQYGHLLEVGRQQVDALVERPRSERFQRWMLREGLTRRWLFGPALALGRLARGVLPAGLARKVGRSRPIGEVPLHPQSRKVFLLRGCTQPSMAPSIDTATIRVLDAIGVQAIMASRAGCCGALRQHLGDEAGALADARRNVDAWWPRLDSGDLEALVINASGCGAQVRDYGHLLRNDPAYAERAARVSALTLDVGEYLAREQGKLRDCVRREGSGLPPRRVVFHPPCTLQHGQKVRGAVEGVLKALGAELTPVPDAHLCCGSAGTYSLLQPGLSTELRDRKLAALATGAPEMILSANIGCLAHLETGTETPVRHWLEWVDAAIGDPRPA